jgi:hypothetical protein
VTTKYLTKFENPRAITQPKIIGPKRNVNLICNLSLYTHIPNIKSISQRIAEKSSDNWWWVTDQVCISFRSNEFWLSYDPWTLKFGQIFSCHHFISLSFEILTWFLVCECIVMTYRWSLNFVPNECFWDNLRPLDF